MKDQTRYALLSVTDKTGIVDFAEYLVSVGYAILSTGGTADDIRKAGIEVTDVSEYTGFPEGMDGRLKTLHPAIHGGILGRVLTDKEFMDEHGISLIDVVAVNLYKFQEAVDEGLPVEDVIKKIDIGGPTMIRAAAKNWRRVTVLTDPVHYKLFASEANAEGVAPEGFRFAMAATAFTLTQQYETSIAVHMTQHADVQAFAETLT